MTNNRNTHPGIKKLKQDLDRGTLTRRDFIRYSTLLGLSAASAYQFVGLNWPSKVFAGSIKRGGTLKVSTHFAKAEHPSRIQNITVSNMLRQVSEYLTYTDANNVTHPYLLENWEASDDLKTWTLNLRKGIKFNNGDKFTSDDVIFTFQQWLSKDVGSSMLGLIGGYLSAADIEKISEYQVKLHLKQPEIGVLEHLFHYPAIVLNHRTFEGDWTKNPHGTGAYSLEKYIEGQYCLLKRRNDYWNMGQDGNPLPYLDKIEFIFLGAEAAPHIAGLIAGEIDIVDSSDTGALTVYNATKNKKQVNVVPITTCQTRILRMRVDLKPWSDNRVRTALKLCQNREKILSLAFFGEGLEGQDFHVSPKHPEYCQKTTPEYDPQRAKELLKQAGYSNGLDINLATNADLPEIVRYAEILKEDARPAGFNINIKTVPASNYWEKWTEYDLGITTWGHRPLGTMVLNLAYTGDENGKPASWNETRWVDKEFSELLKKANGTLDRDERRKIFCRLEEIQQNRGSIGNAFWLNTWLITSKRVHGVNAHPSNYLKFDDTWLSG